MSMQLSKRSTPMVKCNKIAGVSNKMMFTKHRVSLQYERLVYRYVPYSCLYCFVCSTQRWWGHTRSTVPSCGLLNTRQLVDPYWINICLQTTSGPGGTSAVRRGRESWGCWAWGWGRQGDPIRVHQAPQGGVERMEPDSAQRCPGPGPEALGPSLMSAGHPPWARAWTRWPPDVPSSLSLAVVLGVQSDESCLQ